MNASDIVKAKQNKVLYNAYYTPMISSSTIYSTLSVYSTTLNGSLQPVISYTSCTTTAYTTRMGCTPNVTSYETLNQIKGGAYECGALTVSQMQIGGIPNTAIYAYSTLISTMTIQNLQLPVPSSFIVTSTTITAPPTPLITPFVIYRQGCADCNNRNSCVNCATGL
jgi:hypothetical protein